MTMPRDSPLEAKGPRGISTSLLSYRRSRAACVRRPTRVSDRAKLRSPVAAGLLHELERRLFVPPDLDVLRLQRLRAVAHRARAARGQRGHLLLVAGALGHARPHRAHLKALGDGVQPLAVGAHVRVDDELVRAGRDRLGRAVCGASGAVDALRRDHLRDGYITFAGSRMFWANTFVRPAFATRSWYTSGFGPS